MDVVNKGVAADNAEHAIADTADDPIALQVVRFVVLATIIATAASWLTNYFLHLLGVRFFG